MTDIASDDLTRPLGRTRRAARLPIRVSARTVVSVLSGVMIATAAGQVWLAKRSGGASVAEIRRPADAKPMDAHAAGPAVKVDPSIDAAPGKPVMSAQEMENASGVKVIRGGGMGAPESVVIQVGSPSKPKIAPPDRKLLEKSRHGALPRIGPDGQRPSQVYARPVDANAVAGKPRIAILVGGMGISQQTTGDAIVKLPEQVSFAFAPYAADLDKQVQRARGEGHELFLQTPMEPFDYPENDPGPHTLRIGAADADNIDRLQWVMTRIQGYVGLVNFMGAKFTAQETALRPVLKDVADRGLMVLDDGSSNRSQIVAAAASVRAQAARADAVVDAVPRAEMIDRELAKLEAVAREKGVAIGAASGLPMSIERIARWSRALEAKGIVLVPVSNAIAMRRKDGPS